MKDLLGLTIAPGFTWLCWLFSLRRTPYPMLWAIVSFVYSATMIASGLAIALVPKVSTAGMIGAEVGLMCIPGLAAIFTEGCAQHYGGDIYRSRQDHEPRKRRKPRQTKWVIHHAMGENNMVRVFIRAGERHRFIGEADPVEDIEGFQALMVQGEQAIEVYNALKIGQ